MSARARRARRPAGASRSPQTTRCWSPRSPGSCWTRRARCCGAEALLCPLPRRAAPRGRRRPRRRGGVWRALRRGAAGGMQGGYAVSVHSELQVHCVAVRAVARRCQAGCGAQLAVRRCQAGCGAQLAVFGERGGRAAVHAGCVAVLLPESQFCWGALIAGGLRRSCSNPQPGCTTCWPVHDVRTHGRTLRQHQRSTGTLASV